MKSKVNPPSKKKGPLGSRYTSYIMQSLPIYLEPGTTLDPRRCGDHPHVAKREAVWPSPSPGVVTPVAVANEGLDGSLTKNRIFLVVCHPEWGGWIQSIHHIDSDIDIDIDIFIIHMNIFI